MLSCETSPTTSRSSSSWLRPTSINGSFRANKTSRSVLATIEEGSKGALHAGKSIAPGARATVSACFSGTFGRTTSSMSASAAPPAALTESVPYTPLSPARSPVQRISASSRQTVPDDIMPDSDSDSDEDEGGFGFGFGFRAAPAKSVARRAIEGPSSPTESRHTTSTVDSRVQIATARPFRIHTAHARSHSIDVIKGMQLLSPESPSHPFSHPRPSLDLSPTPSPRAYHPLRSETPGSACSPSIPPLRSISPLLVPVSSPSSASPSPSTPLSAPPVRRRVPGPGAIVKDYAALLEHINEDETESHCSAGSSSSGLRTSRSSSVPAFAQRSDSPIVSLPPPPRPRNRALVRPAPHPFANPSVSLPHANSNLSRLPPDHTHSLNSTPRSSVYSLSQLLRHPSSELQAPTLAPAPHTRNFSARAGFVPPTPSAVPLPVSSTSNRFPQSVRSSFPCTPQTSGPPSPRSPAYRSTFLPSCKSTIDSATVKDVESRRSDSIDYFRTSSYSLPYSDFNLPWCTQRASGLSFSSSVNDQTAEAESIPIGLYEQPSQVDISLAPCSPRSSLLREVGVEVDVQLPSPECEEDESDSGSCLTTEEGASSKQDHKSSVKETFRERARSLSAALPNFNVASLSKVDRVLGNGAARALLSGAHAHVPHLSLSSMSSSSSDTTHVQQQPSAPLLRSDSADQSFLPQTGPSGPHSASSFIGLGRKLSKKAVEPNMGRRRSEDVGRVPSGGLIARMGGFIGRTPSPGARTRELEDEVDDVPPPPPPPPLPLPAFKATHGRKHSSSDPSAGIMRPRPSTSDRPATTNVRSASERAEMLKKARKIQQLLGDVPTEDACEGSFYRHSRAARSEDFGDDEFPVRLGGRRHSNPGTFSDVVVTGDQGEEKEGAGGAEGAKVGRVPSQNRNQLKRGFHRPTASASSALQLLPPMTPVSPALISPDSYGLLSPEPETAKSVDEDRGKVGSEAGVGSPKSEKPLIEDSLGLGDETEDELALARRAKRAKVAKLNRYLGSRVPAHLVLGLDESWDYEQGLPEPEPESGVKTEERGLLERTGSGLRVGGRRKVEVEEQEEEIGDLSVMSSEEKARAVRRKAKMEKMFGERPPQKLYQPQSGGDTSGTTALDNLVEGSEGDEEEWEEEGGGEHYKSYRASFNSLAYFVNNADRDSLEGLYNIVSALPESDDQGAEGEEPGDGGKPMRSQFAARRKRAAKLSKFFGVSYRDLFGAVLDILESDVREDKEEGSLSAAETQDLLIKLRKLKAKGEDIRV